MSELRDCKVEVSNKVYKYIEDSIPPDILDSDEFSLYDETKFIDIGMDSMAFRELIFKVENDLNIKIPDEKASNCNKVGEFINLCTEVYKSA